MLAGMRFTEHELTAALTGAAKSVLASRKDVRKRGLDIDTAWEAMSRYERFQMLDALGDQILPVLQPAAKSCKTLTLSLGDGATHTTQFSFTK